MSKFTIYTSNGAQRAVCDKLEYSGSWMGDCFLTVTVKSATPVDFHIGDYIVYRGETFTLNNDPSVLKKARRETYGEGFTYDNIKFSSRATELTDVRFLDIVLADNQIHYTSLPDFTFFSATIDDYCDRLQANTNRWCESNGFALEDYWLFVTPVSERFIQRARCLRKNSQGEWEGLTTEQATAIWNAAYGAGTSVDEEKKDVNVNVSPQNIWESLQRIKNDFGLNFINRNRQVIVGSAGLPTSHLFKYGKDNGLAEIEKTADTEQQVITKLFSYGNSTNLPIRYYDNIKTSYWANSVFVNKDTTVVVIILDVPFRASNFTKRSTSDPGSDESPNYIVNLKVGDAEVRARISQYVSEEKTHCYIKYTGQGEDWAEPDAAKVAAFSAAVAVGSMVYVTAGIKKKNSWPDENREYTASLLPNGMAISRLMLPGFPSTSLYDWVVANGGTAVADDRNCDAYGRATWRDHDAFFSKNPSNPYILSKNFDALGIRESTKIFDGSDESEDIYPTIENTGKDTLFAAQMVSDNGIWEDEEPTVEITLPNFGSDFDLKDEYDAGTQDGGSPTISMKGGYCGGMTFQIEDVYKQLDDGQWKVKCKRYLNDLISRYFPYSYNASEGGQAVPNEPYQLRAGDKYVLTGIPMTSYYINEAAKKLLEYSLIFLDKNDYTRYTYTPKIDEIFMAREHDENGEDSLYSTIKEGDLLHFQETDLAISDGLIFIDTLRITEDGNNGIPTYDITLRNDKQVGTIQRMQEQINSLASGTGGTYSTGGGGINAAQVERLVGNYGGEMFLSKTKDDAAQGVIGFTKGLWIKTKNLFGIDRQGDAKLNNITASGNVEVKGNGIFGGLLTALRSVINSVQSSDFSGHSSTDTGWAITNDFTNGKSRLTVDELYVRARAIFEELVIKQKQVSGGDTIQSCAASHISFVDYLRENPDTHEWEAMGYTTQKVPWTLNGVVRYLINGLRTQVLAKETATRRALTEAEMYEVGRIRCYFLASDGDRKIENWWRVGDLAYCKTLDLDSAAQQKRDEYCPTRTKQGNIEWWRRVEEVSSATKTVDGREYHWFDVKYKKDKEEEATGNLAWCKLNSDLPAGNDAAVQLGHTPPTEHDPNATERMNAIAIEVNGAGNADTPCVKALYGIYTYDLTRCWFGGPAVRMCLSPKSGYKFYGPSFKFVQQYDEVRVPTDRGAYLDITPERDDYAPHDDNVRKCYFYDRVSYEGSLWLCLVPEGQHWVKNNGTEKNPQWDYISDEAYAQLDVELQMLCRRVENYTKDIPSESSSNWQKQVSKGDKGESNLLLDMTNEMDSIACDASGIPTSSQSVSTDIRIFLGTTAQELTSVSWNNSSPELSDGYRISISYSNDRKKATLTVTTDEGQVPVKKNFTLVARCAAGNDKQGVFTVNGIRPGAQGQAAVLYRLVPSVDEIKINKQGQYSVSSLSVQQQKVVGATSSFEQPECYMTVEIDGDGTEQQLGQKNYSATIGTASGNILPTSSITVRIYKTNTNDVYSDLQDVETIPVLIDGTDGKNSVTIHLDNAHEDFLYDDAGVNKSGSATSQAHLWDGGTEKTNDVTWQISDDNGSTWGSSTSTNANASISNTSGSKGLLTVTGLLDSSVKIKVRTEYPASSGKYYYADFTANKTNQDKYELVLKPNSISYNSATYTAKTINISATRLDLQGNKSNVTFGSYNDRTKISNTSKKGYLRLFCGWVDGGTIGTLTQQTNGTLSVSYANAGLHDGVYFELRKYADAEGGNSSTYTIADYQTVNITKAENGNNGNNGNDGNGEETVFIRTKSGTAPKIVDSGGDEKQSTYDNAGWYSSTHASHIEEEFLPVAFVNTGSSSNPEIEANALSSGSGITGTPGTYGECTKSPKGVDETWKYEWEIRRTMTAPDSTGARSWNVFGNSQGKSMSLRNKWASDGAPGDVYEVIAEDSAGGNVSLVSFSKDYANVVSASPAGYTIKLLKNGVVQSSLPSGYGWYWKRQGDNSWTSLGSSATYQRTSKTDFSTSGSYVEAVYYGIGTNASNVLYVKMVSMRWDVQRMLVPAGEWDSAETYIRTGNTTPLVHYHVEGVADYWYLDADSSTGDVPQNTSRIWRICNDFEVILTKMLFAEFARLGSFIVYGNYFISQYGTLVGANGDTLINANNVGTKFSSSELSPFTLNGNNVDNGYITCKVSFYAKAGSTVNIKVTASGDTSDFGVVGKLDNDDLSTKTSAANIITSRQLIMRVGGGEINTAAVNITSTGTHYFYIAYAKNFSGSFDNDNAVFEFSGALFGIEFTRSYSSSLTYSSSIKNVVAYGWFDSCDPMAEVRPTSGYKFRPMKCIDALTGEEWGAGGNVHFSKTGNAEFSGTVRAQNFFHNVVQSTGLNIGNADIVLIYGGTGTHTVILPLASSCHGKIVEIHDSRYTQPSGSTFVGELGVEEDGGGEHMKNSFDSSSATYRIVLMNGGMFKTGGIHRLYSDGTYWILMKTSLDVGYTGDIYLGNNKYLYVQDGRIVSYN